MQNPDYHLIPLASIEIGERFRKDYGDLQQFANDIKARGLLQAIVVERSDPPRLVAGGRRLAAMRLLGWPEVPVRFFDQLDELSRREIELEENIVRKDLTWPERNDLIKKIDELKRLKYGEAPSTGLGGRGNTIANQSPEQTGWSESRTASILGVTTGLVSRELRIARAREYIPSLGQETSINNAERKVNRLVELAEARLQQLQNQKQYDQISSSFLCGDACELILQLDNESVDCIITDPPYGLALGQGRFASRDADNQEFDDSPEAALALLRSLAPQCRRVLKPNGHLYAFFGANLWAESQTIWRNAGFDVDEVINIWVKTGGATGGADWDFRFAPAWEPFMFASNRTRRLAFKHKNTFVYAPESGPSRYHPTQKPVELLRELIHLSTQPGEIVFDPCAGVASTLVAASQLRRKFIGFELSVEFHTIGLKRLVNEGKDQPFVIKPQL